MFNEYLDSRYYIYIHFCELRVNTIFNKANVIIVTANQKKLPKMQLGSYTNAHTCNDKILCNNFTELKVDVSNSFFACTCEKR